MLAKFFLLVVVFFVCMFWWRSRGAAERAKRIAQKRCHELNLQFLDGSVALSKVWLGKSLSGKLQWCRQFRFDFSSDGVNRYTGSVELYGNEVERFEFPPYRE